MRILLTSMRTAAAMHSRPPSMAHGGAPRGISPPAAARGVVVALVMIKIGRPARCWCARAQDCLRVTLQERDQAAAERSRERVQCRRT